MDLGNLTGKDLLRRFELAVQRKDRAAAEAARAELLRRLGAYNPSPLGTKEALRLAGLSAGWWDVKLFEKYAAALRHGLSAEEVKRTFRIRAIAKRKIAILEAAARHVADYPA